MHLTPALIEQQLKTVMDPELHVDIVSLGLIYDVVVVPPEDRRDGVTDRPFVQVTMTLTTPGCPLAGTFDTMVREALSQIVGLEVNEDVAVELTFDPPWVPDMMSAEAKAELGFDT